MKVLRIKEAHQIFELLERFDCIFPHLEEKVDDYKNFSEKLEKHAIVCVAYKNELVCGLLVFYANDMVTKTAYISLIGILPQWQGQQIGQQLLDYCSKVSMDYGMKKIRLEVDLDNYRAIRFYEKYGFCVRMPKMMSSMYMEKDLLGQA